MYAEINPFNNLINEQLSSVIFVQDYLQLDFDGNLISYYYWPVLNFENREYIMTNVNYKNILCEFIGKKVVNVDFKEDILLNIFFESCSNIELVFKDIENEAIYYVSDSGKWSSM
jgi:hypothetical protein